MPKYAAYNTTALQPTPVAAWYDGDRVNHIDFTTPGFIEITEDQWDTRNDKVWCVSGSSLVEYVAPSADINAVRVTQSRILSSACQRQIVSGFSSSALGAANTYASALLDQQNLIQAAQNSNGGLLIVNTTNSWQLVRHTQEEAQQVLADFIIFKDNNRSKLSTYISKVDAATRINDVQSIVWN